MGQVGCRIADPKKLMSLNECPTNTEIFSKRRKICSSLHVELELTWTCEGCLCFSITWQSLRFSDGSHAVVRPFGAIRIEVIFRYLYSIPSKRGVFHVAREILTCVFILSKENRKDRFKNKNDFNTRNSNTYP